MEFLEKETVPIAGQQAYNAVYVNVKGDSSKRPVATFAAALPDANHATDLHHR
ncbi:MAG TPA: hypothetical protein VL051_03490 [Burkholderiaceae bacterium]|nr:hypothetical protein [Burkholderiaceae bacterium]